ncbi:MAG: flagellar basal body P-ring formation protein FlgA, partial [Bdellovibrionales bacterium]|nr:flagellar basal body P-ring formation protein FlgA [Bdellovibrionales bacterium]
PRGNFAQKLLVTGQDGRNQTFWINGLIEVTKRVPVLVRSTPMSTRFTEDDFQFQMRDITFATDTTPTPKEIIGQQAKYTMNANDIIWRGSLVREKAVQRGEIVKVSVANENWEISVQARTEQDGYVGDTVNLRNLQSNRIITGRVIGSGEVEIR